MVTNKRTASRKTGNKENLGRRKSAFAPKRAERKPFNYRGPVQGDRAFVKRRESVILKTAKQAANGSFNIGHHPGKGAL
jgi:hypothetical protein